MAWEVDRAESFARYLKSLERKFPNAGSDIEAEFKSPPEHSDPLPAYRRLLWKARVASTDLNRGRSGSFRVIYYWDQDLPNWCCLAACYFKGDCEDLSPKEYVQLFASLKARIQRRKQQPTGNDQAPTEL